MYIIDWNYESLFYTNDTQTNYDKLKIKTDLLLIV